MPRPQLLLVAGTHGNEINAPWLFSKWSDNPELINEHGLDLFKIIGNPLALKEGKRYIDCDLNRSFHRDFLNCQTSLNFEVNRAKELVNLYSLGGVNPCQIAIDFHSTTSAMGSCMVVYGRRPADLAFASLIQSRLGLPVYLHEGDKTQQGFLVEAWPCGVVIEIGPVPQGVLKKSIVDKTRIALTACLEVISKVRDGLAPYPENLIVHRHLHSIDFPRDMNGKLAAMIHPEREGSDWELLTKDSPLFINLNGTTDYFHLDEEVIPVFINEAAYREKNIAMSFTKREVWPVLSEWGESFQKLFLAKNSS